MTNCSDVYRRWMSAKCYCDNGSYYSSGWPRSSTNGGQNASDCTRDANCCEVSGEDVWSDFYLDISVVELIVFTLLFIWCAYQCFRLYRAAADKIHKTVHYLALLAIGLRISYIVAETWAVQTYDVCHDSKICTAHKICSTISPYFYSSFFPLAASSFLCIYHYWLRFIAAIDEPDSVSRMTLWRSPICVVPVLLSVELFRDILCLSGEVMGGGKAAWVQMVNGCYFVWLSLVDVVVAASGLIVAQRLRLRVNAWLPFLSGSSLGKVQVCTVTISITSVFFLVLSILQSVVGRFAAWPYLQCRIIGSMLEVVYLLVIFAITGHIQQFARNNNSLELPVGSQFSEDMISGSICSFRSDDGTGLT